MSIDHVAASAGRVLYQYQNSPKLKAIIAGLAGLVNDTEAFLNSFQSLLSPGANGGVVLDNVVGWLVGASRQVGGLVLSDADYVKAIWLKVARNNSQGRLDDLAAALGTLFGLTYDGTTPTGVQVSTDPRSGPGLSISIMVPSAGVPTAVQQALLSCSYMPIGMGVGVSRRAWYDPNDYFGWSEDSSSHGWSENSDGGGTWAQEF